MPKKFVIDIHLERSEQSEYPLLDANQILLNLAEQFAALTQRHDLRVPYPQTFKLDDPELGYSGVVTAGLVDTDDTKKMSKAQLVAALRRKDKLFLGR